MFSIGTEENEKTIESPPKGPYVVPNFLPLDSKVLADLYWYDYESMYEQIDYAEVNEYTSEELNNLALKLITAYDLSQNEKLLDIANYLLLKMSSALDNAYECIINMCQIDLRKAAALTQENRIKLKEVEKSLSSEQQPDNPNFLPAFYCIAVVNRDINKADKLYNSFTDADRIIVDKWPIRTLHLLLPSIIETSE